MKLASTVSNHVLVSSMVTFTLVKRNSRCLRDRKTDHYRALTGNIYTSAVTDHAIKTEHNMKWDHFAFLANGRSDLHCKIKETCLIRELKPTLSENVGSEKLWFY